jgi:S-disulfanyl-L-cysteine oxidoreductase SoxD
MLKSRNFFRVLRAFRGFRNQSSGRGATRADGAIGGNGAFGVSIPGRPRHALSTFAAIACILAATTTAGAQTKKPAPKAAKVTKAPPVPYTGPSTLNGIYTDEQALRGRDVYLGSCKSCHSPQSHTGATFNQWWRGKQLSDLFTFVKTRMPKNDPGSLAPEDAADVIAYLLKMNAMPVGENELYPDADSLKQFRIEAKRSAAASTKATTATATRKKP